MERRPDLLVGGPLPLNGACPAPGWRGSCAGEVLAAAGPRFRIDPRPGKRFPLPEATSAGVIPRARLDPVRLTPVAARTRWIGPSGIQRS